MRSGAGVRASFSLGSGGAGKGHLVVGFLRQTGGIIVVERQSGKQR